MATRRELLSPPRPVRSLGARVAERVSLTIFIGIHVACLAAIWTGVTWQAVAIGVALYWLRMFIVTAGYHRYFSHRTYKTSRFFQFILGLLGTTTVQKGPIWWAATHRLHHKYSDTDRDIHSPVRRGFWWSHVGWVLSDVHSDTDEKQVRDLLRYPELRWLGRWHFVAPVAMAVGCFLLAGWPGLIVGFGWSTVAGWHGSFTINSLAHVFGKRRYQTTDDSRNNWFLALLTMGEGWHNNHHYYPSSANQGFFWWEVDASYYVLKLFEKLGLVWDLRKPPARALAGDPEAQRVAAEPIPPGIEPEAA